MVCLLMETKFTFMTVQMMIRDTADVMMGHTLSMESASTVVWVVKLVTSLQLNAGLVIMDLITTMKNVFHANKSLQDAYLVILKNVFYVTKQLYLTFTRPKVSATALINIITMKIQVFVRHVLHQFLVAKNVRAPQNVRHATIFRIWS